MPDCKPTILIADDEPEILEMLRHAFEESGFRVRTASDGSSALVEVLTEPPDLLILDMRMPGLTGWDVVHALGGAEAARRTPVILISGNPWEVGDRKAERLAVKAIVTKPFSVEWLVQTARACVAGHA